MLLITNLNLHFLLCVLINLSREATRSQCLFFVNLKFFLPIQLLRNKFVITVTAVDTSSSGDGSNNVVVGDEGETRDEL